MARVRETAAPAGDTGFPAVNGKGNMSKRDQFLAFVLVGSLAQDGLRGTRDSQLVTHIASQIPEEQIPDNAMNAAKVFLAFCNGLCKDPHDWMLARKAG